MAARRVAMLAPIAWRVPPRHYGPWEQVVSVLTEGLVARGVDVTLFATADSHTSGQLAAVCPHPYAEDETIDPKVWECLHIASAFERAAEFDIIHNHFDFLPLSYSALVATPVLTTIHGFSSEKILPVYQRYNQSTHYVSISEANRDPSLSYCATVYNGIPMEDFSLRQGAREYLLFFGRIHPDKGAAEAIRVAKQSGQHLILAGIVQDRDYYARQIAPHIDNDQIRYIGVVGPQARNMLLGRATALLHLINFEEPFGLTMIEAMACGTPVIAYRRGSIPEVVDHGRTGFIVEDEAAAVAALGMLGQLEPAQIRAHVAAHFSREQMVEGYLKIYESILSPRRTHASE
ncbi:glycosyltransferase family 4 protein [Chloroflexia bacterium SDU3-3]|nr:glycosyltransferase family 4 protein [Chloroflexia bacterium SDU3-3]